MSWFRSHLQNVIKYVNVTVANSNYGNRSDSDNDNDDDIVENIMPIKTPNAGKAGMATDTSTVVLLQNARNTWKAHMTGFTSSITEAQSLDKVETEIESKQTGYGSTFRWKK